VSRPKPLGRFLELGYVTSDLGAAMAAFRAEFGIERWMETGIATIDLGAGRTAQLKIAVAFMGRVLIELQEPIGGDVDWYRDVLPQQGFAVRLHHLGFGVPSAEALDAARDVLAGSHAVPFSGPFGTGSRYFFADARDRLGLYLEYIHFGSEFDGAVPVNPPAIVAGGRLADTLQIAWVTTDYDRALTILRDDYGFERFFETGLVDADLGGGQMAKLKVAIADLDGIQFELIAPISGAVDLHRMGLPDDGSFATRFHHLAFFAPDRATLERIRAGAAARGDRMPIHGEFGSSGYFYVDSRERVGHCLEYIYYTPDYDALIPRNLGCDGA